MKHLLLAVLSCALTGCGLLMAPADAPATINRGHWRGRQVMFTFDARENDEAADQVLDILRSNRVPAAFFVTGQFVEQHPELTRRIAAEGHEIYNHSYSNPLLRHTPPAKIIEQLRRTDAAIVRAIGHSSKPFFRPAYGESDENLRRVAFAEGYRVVRWNVESKDWQENVFQTSTNMTTNTTAMASDGSASSAQQRAATEAAIEKEMMKRALDKFYVPPDPVLLYASNLVKRFESGSIVLLHVGYTNTAAMLEPLIRVTRGKDFTIVPLREGVK